MKIFIDSADIKEIKEANEMGVLDGVTTNPSLIAKTGKDLKTILDEIMPVMGNRPVNVEIMSTVVDDMVKEARELLKFGDNLVFKIPATIEGLKAVRKLSDKEIKTNVTLCFSANQAVLVAKAGANYISPFVGRLDDVTQTGMDLISEINTICLNYKYKTEIIVASIRNPLHVRDTALIGAHIATIPFSVIKQLMKHPLTDIGIEKFNEDWKKCKN